MRYLVYLTILVCTGWLVYLVTTSALYWWLLVPFAALSLAGTWDLLQPHHSLRRNYPLISYFRWLIEELRPALRQYLFESEEDGRPFSREQRALVYRRAKGVNDQLPFGTVIDVYQDGYEWINHSVSPRPKSKEHRRVHIGGSQCARPYDASIFNISAMSFGALSSNAILALNRGAKMGGFAHDTGEGAISRYHREPGGDLIWEIGSGYFGCRTPDGRFDAGKFTENATLDQVKMIEVKLSQGAKPGHGGVLPAAKVSAEIAAARGVPVGQDCISPPSHSAFSTPVEFLEFLARLRELSGGKPVGFKLCIGHPVEFMAIAKAMLETGIRPDFVVIDGSEGGTGAAPLELTNRVGTPLREGLIFARNVLVGAGLRDEIRIGASGKITSGYYLAANIALGADWCNSARGFMFALGCIQSLSCHTDRCPTGVATQDPLRKHALAVGDKSQRVANYQHHTVMALNNIVASAGLDSPSQLKPQHLYRRFGTIEVRAADECYTFLEPGALLDGAPGNYGRWWARAEARAFS